MRGSEALAATAIALDRTNSGFREQGPLCVCWERAGLQAIRSVLQTRRANAKQMELSPAAHVEGLDATLSDPYAMPS
jgi:hypothetical protein